MTRSDLAAHAMTLIEERGKKEGREGRPFSPPPISSAAHWTAYRLNYHATMPSRYER